MVVSQRRSGGAAALVAAAVLLLLGLSDHVVEAKKVKRVKAGTTYKTHDRKLTISEILRGPFIPGGASREQITGAVACCVPGCGWAAGTLGGMGLYFDTGMPSLYWWSMAGKFSWSRKCAPRERSSWSCGGGGPVGLVGRRVAHNCTHGDQCEMPQ